MPQAEHMSCPCMGMQECGIARKVRCRRRGCTDLVEQEDERLGSASLAHIALDVSAARRQRVPGIQHLDDDVSSIHDLDKLLVEGPSGAICKP